MAQNDVWAARIVYEVNNVACNNNLYFAENNGVLDPDIQGMVDAMAIYWGGAFATAASSDVQFLALACRRITGITTPQFVGRIDAPGLLAGDAAPSTQVAVVRHYSRPSSIRTRGRLFFAGCLETDTENGRLTAAGILRFAGIINALKDQNIPAGTINTRTVHWSPLNEQSYEITKVQVRPNLTTLASRQLKQAM